MKKLMVLAVLFVASACFADDVFKESGVETFRIKASTGLKFLDPPSNELMKLEDMGTAGKLTCGSFVGTWAGDAITDAYVSNTLTASTLTGGNSTTLLGSIPYQSNTNTTTMLSPNTTTTKKFLRQTGNGTNGAAPAWDTIVANDLPTLIKDISGLTPTDNYPLIGNGTTFTNEAPATFKTSIGLGTGDSPNFTALSLGVTDTTFGALTLNGDNADTGGRAWFLNPANKDGNTDVYGIRADGDLIIGRLLSSDIVIDQTTGVVTFGSGTSQLSATSASSPVISGIGTSAGTTSKFYAIHSTHSTSGDMAAGFGSGVSMYGTDAGGTFKFGAVTGERASVDTEGTVKIWAGTNGEDLVATFDSALKTTLAGDLTLPGVLSMSTITTFTADDTTPSVSAGNTFVIPGTWTAGHNITMFDNGVAGQVINVIGGDADCTVVNGGNLILQGDWVGAAGYTLPLVFSGTNWYETTARLTSSGSGSASWETPGRLGYLVPNTVKGTTFEATGATFTTPATFGYGAAGTALTFGAATGFSEIKNAEFRMDGYAWNTGYTSATATTKHCDRILSFVSTAWYEVCTINMGAAASWSNIGMHIRALMNGVEPNYGAVEANVQFSKDASGNYVAFVNSFGPKGQLNFKVRDMGSNVYAIWVYGQSSGSAGLQVVYSENVAGLASFANFGVAGTGGSADLAETGTYAFGGSGLSFPATFALGGAGCTNLTLGSGATTLSLGAGTGTLTINNTTLGAKAVTASVSNKVLGTNANMDLTISGSATAFIANTGPQIYTTSDGGTSPFTAQGHLVIQPRTSADRSIYFCTGTTTPLIQLAINTASVNCTPPFATVGGVHVGSTSDPGADNLIVDGTSKLTGVLTLEAASAVLPATFTFGGAGCTSLTLGSGATTLSLGTATGTATINNAITAIAGRLTTVGGAHIGGTSDPGTDNLLVDGTSTFTGQVSCSDHLVLNSSYSLKILNGTNTRAILSSGAMALGEAGAERGFIALFQGAGGNTAGYIKIHSRNGTAHYIWVEDDGTVKQSTAVPVDNADGNVVGAQT